MRKILNIAWKDTLVRFATPSELLFFLVLPLLFTFLLGGSLWGGEEDRIPLLVVDEDSSVLASGLVESLVEIESLEVMVHSRAQAEERFEDEEAPALLIIPIGFEASLLNGNPAELDFRKVTDNSDAEAAEQAVLTAANKMSRNLAVASASLTERERLQTFQDQAQRDAYFSQSLKMAQGLFDTAPERVEVTVPEESGVGIEEVFDPAAQSSAGQLITWVFIPLLGISAVFAYERTTGTLRRLLTTPTKKATYLLGTIAGQMGQAIVQMVLLLLFAIYVMGVEWGKAPDALVVLLLSFAFASVALGTMLGAFVKTDGQAINISIAAGMAMALLGGCWYPSELFPETARVVTKFFPTGWAMQGLSDIVMRGKGLVDILPASGVLLGFAVVFFVIGLWRFRYE